MSEDMNAVKAYMELAGAMYAYRYKLGLGPNPFEMLMYLGAHGYGSSSDGINHNQLGKALTRLRGVNFSMAIIHKNVPKLKEKGLVKTRRGSRGGPGKIPNLITLTEEGEAIYEGAKVILEEQFTRLNYRTIDEAV